MVMLETVPSLHDMHSALPFRARHHHGDDARLDGELA